MVLFWPEQDCQAYAKILYIRVLAIATILFVFMKFYMYNSDTIILYLKEIFKILTNDVEFKEKLDLTCDVNSFFNL